MRLIDADAEAKWCRNHVLDAAERSATLEFLRNCSTIDAVPVVHCKDCVRFVRNRGITDSPNGHCFYLDAEMNGHDFCSYGERKDGETNG